ncbi:PDDEXK nuclease domain-containing protein [Chitinophaga sedimenti]|uniref:PDDEXK nuclease domain-containing protein n=1 Tax=Chitinophaga sedimenti TaxID=2033606 RepID=UPI00200419A1|nr:PDDEXK nuclease domain-containing protein [Chitinophaga sedimenti]MCK7556224.1 PDDEXK nuclease domain-containing protein [Chitinophaga sedimenti]
MRKRFLPGMRELLLAPKRNVHMYWEAGRRIVQEERGRPDELLKALSDALENRYPERDLRRIRQFYLTFPNRDALRPELTWSHYRALISVSNEGARSFYLEETLRQSWTVRQLERNISSRYFERMQPGLLKDPYVLEFLGLDEAAVYSESDVESAIILNIQSFLLELGTGFSFVARQYRIRTETKVFFIDLVFYHYILKCFVLIDLKIAALTHQDIGQMDMYVRMFEALKRGADDLPTLGIILCKEKDQTIVKYSVLEESAHLFASKYSLVLPSEDALKAVLER